MSRDRSPAGLSLLVLALLLHASSAQNDTTVPVTTVPATSLPITGAACTLNADGSYSGAGTCTGPSQRSEVRYGNLSITNGGTECISRRSISSSHARPPGCPADQLLFYVDGDMTQPKVRSAHSERIAVSTHHWSPVRRVQARCVRSRGRTACVRHQ